MSFTGVYLLLLDLSSPEVPLTDVSAVNTYNLHVHAASALSTASPSGTLTCIDGLGKCL